MTTVKLFLTGTLVALIATSACSRSSAEASPAQAEATAQSQTKALPRLVDLGAGKCVSCKAMTPVLAGLQRDFAGKIQVNFIDVWENRAAAEPWRIAIIPTQIFLAPDGRELWRHEGFISREDILARFKDLGFSIE